MAKNILINTSNIKEGGGIQVAHSCVYELRKYPKYNYIIVLSEQLSKQLSKDDFPSNFKFYDYTNYPSVIGGILGINKYLDNIVSTEKVDFVFSIFGPSYWKSKVKQMCGYALPHYVYKDSPFYNNISFFQKMRLWMKERLQLSSFRKHNDVLVTENHDVTEKLKSIFPSKEIYTVTNYYNQVFDAPNYWDRTIELPDFEGVTLLTISSNYHHKNLQIIPRVADYLRSSKPHFKFRFVLTLDESELSLTPAQRENIVCIGRVNISQCPHLYEQSDFMFLPTLLECFSASYPEAMRMNKPILTSNLPFAKGICGDAALYFDPLSPEDIGNKIYELSQSIEQQKKIVEKGILRLEVFDNSEIRTKKYLNIIESNFKNNAK